MNVREAVALAKKYITETFADEKISELGLEEIEFDEGSQTWLITIGFTRLWQNSTNLGPFERFSHQSGNE